MSWPTTTVRSRRSASTRAPNEERILEHASLLGRHHIDQIYEIGGQVSPADFPT